MDTLYYYYFVSHLAAALFVDLPITEWLGGSLSCLSGLRRFYLSTYEDPILLIPAPWKTALFSSELFFQVPFFIWVSLRLRKKARDPVLWVAILIYGVHAFTTTWCCMFELFAEKKWMIMSFYFPYLAIPLWMAIDMGGRLVKSCHAAKSGPSSTITSKSD